MYDFSVIIPVYNGEKFLAKCLDSLYEQTFENIQIIVINDGSIDNSKNIIEKYQSKKKNIIFIDKNNEGAGEARNTGLRYAAGEYITFLDCDDILHPLTFEIINYHIKNIKVDILEYGIARQNSQLALDKKFEELILSKREALERFCRLNINGYSCGKVFKRELIHENGIEFSKSFCFEDMQFVLKAIQKCQNYKIIYHKLYYYRENETSLSNNMTINHFKTYMNERENWIKILNENNSNIYNSIEVFKLLTYINCVTWFLNSKYFSQQNYKKIMKNEFQIKKNDLNFFKIIKLPDITTKYKIVFLLILLRLYPKYIKQKRLLNKYFEK